MEMKNISGDFSTYWMESSLRDFPRIEQVELLIKLQNNRFRLCPENINAVEHSTERPEPDVWMAKM